ncbi:hypothetical protein HDZ31DRAFT_64928 [Schizophyllum fasciatum]
MSGIYRAASPYGRSASPNPYGQPPASPYAQPASVPYGQPAGSVYGAPAGAGGYAAAPYGQAPTTPYAPPAASPYAPAPYAQSPYAPAGTPAYGARAASPYAPPATLPHTPGPATPYGEAPPQPQPQGQAAIQPGSITYTTSTGPDGRLVYHPFKAVPASYKTSAGVVTGIQWVPAEATSILPSGAQPANDDFVSSWTRTGRLNAEEERSVKEWQRDEDRRRRREEREAGRRLRDKSQARERSSVRGDDFELERARERDGAARSRRKSFVGGAPAPAYGAQGMPGGTSPYAAPTSPYVGPTSPYAGGAPGGGYAGSGYAGSGYAGSGYAGSAAGGGYARERKYSTGEQLAAHMADLDLDRGVDYSARQARRRSAYGAPDAGGYATRPTTPGYGGQVYPKGHIMEGQPIPAGQPYPTARSRATTPAPPSHNPLPGTTSSAYGGPVTFPSAGMGASPNLGANLALAGGPPLVPETGQLAAPEAFSRPPNAAMPYTPFASPLLVAQLAELARGAAPPMPLVLGPHDVAHEDWARMLADVARAWAGQLPGPDGARRQKRSALVAHMLDAWNASFFGARGVEVVLYKGRERRSGPGAGLRDGLLPQDGAGLSSTEESDTTESELDEEGSLTGAYGAAGGAYGGAYGAGGGGGAYGRGADGVYGRQAGKEERRRRRREKRARRKEREMHKTYSLHVLCLPQGGPGGAGATVQAMAGTPAAGMASPYHRGY